MSPSTTKNGDSSVTGANGTVPTIVKPELEPARAESAAGDAPVDYFSGAHSNPAPTLGPESNPFDVQFGGGEIIQTPGGALQTPGGTKLPSVAHLTSGAGHLGNWPSLRSGPLSPNMLSGPTKGDDYFGDHHLRGFQNHHTESGIRTGLTPGGSGTMFPVPLTPSIGSIFGTVATPSANEFAETAEHAKQLLKRDLPPQPRQNITSQPQQSADISDVKPRVPFDQHDPNEAASGLIFLANNNRNAHHTSHYAPAPQMPIHGHPQPMHMANHSHEASPVMEHRTNGSTGTLSGGAGSDMSEPENEQEMRPNTRGKGKRNSTQMSQANGRTQPRTKPNKRAKANGGHAMEEPEDEPEEVLDLSKEEYNANGKKMTDEDKRKNFLERNRVAALKCRQRKKQWLSNLQSKADNLELENMKLSEHISVLTNELHNMKTFVHAHKNCPDIASQLNLSNDLQQHQAMEFNGQVNGQMNPYGMAAVQQQQAAMNHQAHQNRRFSNTMT